MRVWDPSIRSFAQRFSVIRYDMRGFGRSSVPNVEGYSRAEDLHALLRYLQVQQAPHPRPFAQGAPCGEFRSSLPDATKETCAGRLSSRRLYLLERIPQTVR